MMTSYARVAGSSAACLRAAEAAERGKHRTRARPHHHRHPAWRAHL